MLQLLEVDGLGVLDRVSVAFGPGLNALSGETGAGKSLLLDALELALGARGGASLVRPDRAAARVDALFAVPPGSAAARALAALGVEPEDGAVLLSRELGADGRGAARCNGRLVTQALLRQVGALLVAVVGQGDQHRFASPRGQLAFLDAYGGPEVEAARARVAAAHAAWQAAREAVRAAGSAAERARRRAELEERLAEIGAVDPQPGEDEALRQRRQVLAHAEQLAGGLARCLGRLRADEPNAMDLLAEARRELGALLAWDPGLAEPQGLLEQAWIALDEASRLLGRARERVRLVPGERERVEARWTELERLKRRYGPELADVLARRRELEAELEALDAGEAEAAAAAARVEELRDALGEAAAALGALRAEAARRLEAEVGSELEALGMPGARFRVTLAQEPDPEGVPVGGRAVACGPDGAERVAFLWAANPGLPEAPLARAASGGELSRLLLALYALRAQEGEVPTVVFDEIDAGVGGRAAEAVASRLQRLAEARQVLCVTHQAVVAAAADHHFVVEKAEGPSGAAARVAEVRGEERTREVARMLDGDRSPTSRAHAAELLRRMARPRAALGA